MFRGNCNNNLLLGLIPTRGQSTDVYMPLLTVVRVIYTHPWGKANSDRYIEI